MIDYSQHRARACTHPFALAKRDDEGTFRAHSDRPLFGAALAAIYACFAAQLQRPVGRPAARPVPRRRRRICCRQPLGHGPLPTVSCTERKVFMYAQPRARGSESINARRVSVIVEVLYNCPELPLVGWGLDRAGLGSTGRLGSAGGSLPPDRWHWREPTKGGSDRIGCQLETHRGAADNLTDPIRRKQCVPSGVSKQAARGVSKRPPPPFGPV